MHFVALKKEHAETIRGPHGFGSGQWKRNVFVAFESPLDAQTSGTSFLLLYQGELSACELFSILSLLTLSH